MIKIDKIFSANRLQISLPICESATNLPAYLQMIYKSPCLFVDHYKSPCLFANHPQISLPICAKNFAYFYSFDQWKIAQELIKIGTIIIGEEVGRVTSP